MTEIAADSAPVHLGDLKLHSGFSGATDQIFSPVARFERH